MRTCSKCGEAKELSVDNFRFNAKGGRFMYYCLTCEHVYKIEWQRKNAEKRSGYAAQDRQRHPDRFKEYDRKNRQTRTATQIKRRAQAGIITEEIDRMVIYVRDGGTCQICDQPVSEQEFQVDHVIPIAKGGPHLYTNVQVAHGTCNRKKGMKMLLEGAGT